MSENEPVETGVMVNSERSSDLPLSGDSAQQEQLIHFEEMIEQGAIGYFSAGYALEEIQKRKLYKCRDCKTFAEYCKKRFDISRSYGYRLIAYNRVHSLLGKDDKRIPERLLRPLNGLNAQEIEDVWKQAKRQSKVAVPAFKKLKELADGYKSKRKQKRQEDKKIKCRENEFFSVVLNQKVKVVKIENPVDFIIEKAEDNIDKLARLYQEFSPHIKFDETQRIKLKKQVEIWQSKILDDFKTQIGL